MFLLASLIAIIFVIGVILIMGWLTIANLLGEFNDRASGLVQEFCDTTSVLSNLFLSTQKFIQDPRSKILKKNLYDAIDKSGVVIGKISDEERGEQFSYLFRSKVKIYAASRKKMDTKEKLRRLKAVNRKIGKVFGGRHILNQIDEYLLEPEVGSKTRGTGSIGKLIIQIVDVLIKK